MTKSCGCDPFTARVSIASLDDGSAIARCECGHAFRLPPPVQGGQGRDAADLARRAWLLLGILAAVAVLCLLAWALP
jgi:hypothetical protein